MPQERRRGAGRLVTTPFVPVPYQPRALEGLGPDAAAVRRLIEEQLLRGQDAGPEYVSFSEAVRLTGVDRWRIGRVIKRAGVPVYRSVADARRKLIRREDVPRLTGVRLLDPGTPDDLAEPMGGAATGG